MRIDKRSSRTLSILFDNAVPRREDGALNLCADCQRWIWFEGGYPSFLANRLLRMAETVGNLHRHYRAMIERLEIGDKHETTTRYRDVAAEIVRAVAFSKEWTLRCQRWTDGRVIVWRLA